MDVAAWPARLLGVDRLRVVPHAVALCAAGTAEHVGELLERSGYSALV